MTTLLKLTQKGFNNEGFQSLFRYFKNLEGVHYEKGQFVFESDMNDSMIFIEKGKACILNKESHEMLYQEQYVYAGSFANLETAFDRRAYKNCYLEIKAPTIIKKVSFSVFDKLLINNILFNQMVLQLLASKVRTNQKKVNQLRFMSARYRILVFLLELANRKGRVVGYEIVVDSPPTQLEIAVSASTARQTVTSFLSQLRQDLSLIHI